MNEAERKAGMAMVRARMLAAHQRQLARTDLKAGDRKGQEWAVRTIQAAQKARNEA